MTSQNTNHQQASPPTSPYAAAPRAQTVFIRREDEVVAMPWDQRMKARMRNQWAHYFPSSNRSHNSQLADDFDSDESDGSDDYADDDDDVVHADSQRNRSGSTDRLRPPTSGGGGGTGDTGNDDDDEDDIDEEKGRQNRSPTHRRQRSSATNMSLSMRNSTHHSGDHNNSKPLQYRLETVRPSTISSNVQCWKRWLTCHWCCGLWPGHAQQRQQQQAQAAAATQLAVGVNPNQKLAMYLHWMFRVNFVFLFLVMCLMFFVLVIIFAGFITIAGNVDAQCVVIGGSDFATYGTAFADAFSLSWTTFSTVGYGSSYPALGYQNDNPTRCFFISFVCSIESLLGVLYSGFCGAILFGKVLRIQSHAQVQFSDPIVIRYGSGVLEENSDRQHKKRQHDNDDEDAEDDANESNDHQPPVLEFRIVNRLYNEIGGEIMDATINVVANVDANDDHPSASYLSSSANPSMSGDGHERRHFMPSLRLNHGRDSSGRAGDKAAEPVEDNVSEVSTNPLGFSESSVGSQENSTNTTQRSGVTAGVVGGGGGILPRNILHSVRSLGGLSHSSNNPHSISSSGSSSLRVSRNAVAGGGSHLRSRPGYGGGLSNMFQQPHLSVIEDPSTRLVSKQIFTKMHIEASDHPFFKRQWLVRHILDEHSPILKQRVRRQIRRRNGRWPARLNSYQDIRDALQFNQILVSLTGVSNVSASDVYAQKIYDFVDINIGYQFVNILYRDEHDQSLQVDTDLINDVREQNGGGGEPLIME